MFIIYSCVLSSKKKNFSYHVEKHDSYSRRPQHQNKNNLLSSDTNGKIPVCKNTVDPLKEKKNLHFIYFKSLD